MAQEKCQGTTSRVSEKVSLGETSVRARLLAVPEVRQNESGFKPLKGQRAGSLCSRNSGRGDRRRSLLLPVAQCCRKCLDGFVITFHQVHFIVVGSNGPESVLRLVGQVKHLLPMPEGNH